MHYKGSISVNGISLTIAQLNKSNFSVNVITHTFNQTNLKYLKVNDLANIEVDMLARYVTQHFK